MKKCLLLAAVMIVFAGCAQKLTGYQLIRSIERATKRSMSRTYEGITKEQAIAIAEQALWYSDDDIKVDEHRSDGFFATRNWSFFSVAHVFHGTDRWRITVDEDAETPNRVTVQAVSWLGSAASGIGSGSQIVLSDPKIPVGSIDQHYFSPHLYTLFFDRFDFFAGLRDTWEPCGKDLDKSTYVSTTGLKNGQDPLCLIPDKYDPTKNRPPYAPQGPKPTVRD
jgi:uncharacterized protein YneR